MLKIALIATVIMFALQGFAQRPGSDASPITYKVPFDYLEGCETGRGTCNPVTITRKSKTERITLVFPSGGTQSDVYLWGILAYDLPSKGGDQPRPLRHDEKRAEQGLPTLNLTGLPDGAYTASMISCGLGGSFKLILVTKTN